MSYLERAVTPFFEHRANLLVQLGASGDHSGFIGF